MSCTQSKKEMLVGALKAHAEGNIAKHLANIDMQLRHGVAVPEHPDTIEYIQSELNKVAEFNDQLEIIDKYIDKNTKTELFESESKE